MDIKQNEVGNSEEENKTRFRPWAHCCGVCTSNRSSFDFPVVQGRRRRGGGGGERGKGLIEKEGKRGKGDL